MTNPQPVGFFDLSTKGARIEAENYDSVGVVYVTIRGFGPMQATITWTNKSGAGLQLSERLHASEIEHLAQLSREAQR